MPDATRGKLTRGSFGGKMMQRGTSVAAHFAAEDCTANRNDDRTHLAVWALSSTFVNEVGASDNRYPLFHIVSGTSSRTCHAMSSSRRPTKRAVGWSSTRRQLARDHRQVRRSLRAQQLIAEHDVLLTYALRALVDDGVIAPVTATAMPRQPLLRGRPDRASAEASRGPCTR
jgi:hypothetical protein